MIERIVTTSATYHGHPILKDSKIAVQSVIDTIVGCDSLEEVLDTFPGLTRDDISACLEYGLTH